MDKIPLYLLIGLFVGVVSGAFGIGGGILLVPALMFCGLEFAHARGTSLAVLVLPVVLPGAWRYFSDSKVDVGAAFCIAVAFAVGGYVGAHYVRHFHDDLLRPLFGFLMLFVAMRFIVAKNHEVIAALSGLAATGAALAGYFVLRALGRRHATPPPSLGEAISRKAARGDDAVDYYI